LSKPKPIPEALVCSECGLDWDLHPENPRRRDCIKLLQDHHSRVIVPWTNPAHYCNHGHLNCWIHHDNWWATYSSDTFGNYGAGITSISSEDDDPDMGVQAKVS